MVYRFVVFLSLFSLNAYSQDILSRASVSLELENKINFIQKLYLHTDKSFYVAGDIIWFKVYNTEGYGNKPLSFEKMVYVELLDLANKPVLQAKIPLDGKTGNGSFHLPLSVPTGNYILRSYTSRMKNNSADYFFRKKITVVNSLKNPGMDSLPVTPAVFTSFYPEGGNLVNGLPSTLAFKLTNEQGRGVDATGFLMDASNDTLQKISTLAFGMGSFVHTPVAGKEYRTVFILPDGSEISSKIPPAFEQGYVMHIDEQEGGMLKVTVSSNFAQDGTEIFLFGHTRQRKKLSQQTNITMGKAVFLVNKNAFDKGISVLTVFAAGKPVCERLLFQKPVLSTLQAETDKAEYFSRSKVALNIKGAYDSALLSLAVYKVDTLQARDEMDIVNYLWLTSELSGNVEHPSFYFSDHLEAEKAADHLMLTHGWRRFSWDEILSASAKAPMPVSFEAGQQTISARVVDPVTQQPVKDISVFLSIPLTRHKLFASTTGADGIAKFQVKDFYGSGDVILQMHPSDSMYKLEIVSPFSDRFAPIMYSRYHVSGIHTGTLEDYSIAMQAANIYHGDKLSLFRNPASKDSFPFYGKASVSYDLDDYKRFTTVEEVLREYVREINVGVRGSGLTLKVFNEHSREMKEANNLVTIDGVPVFNTKKLFGYDPLKFKKIEVIPMDYVLGKDKFNAVAAFYTYTQDFRGLEAEPGALVVSYEGLQNQREFYSPQYQNEQQIVSRIPDMRTTLHWQTVLTSDKIDFFTSDTKGRYLVSLQGFDLNGAPVSWNKFIVVK